MRSGRMGGEFVHMEEYLRELSHVKLLEPEEEQGLWLRYRQQKDEEARRLIIESYQPLVFRTALPYRTMENIMDVIQEGTVGLIEAVEGFDPSRGVAFSLYAVHRIRGRMLDFLGKEHAADTPCMDAQYGEMGLTWKECLVDEGPSVQEQAEMDELAGRLRQAMERLPGKERAVLEDIYLKSGKVTDAAERLQVSAAHVYRLQKTGIRRIRGMLSKFIRYW